MLRIATSALLLGLSPGILGVALAGNKTPCKPLAKLRADFDASTHFTTLTAGQFHFVEASTSEAHRHQMAYRLAMERCSQLMTAPRMVLLSGPAAF